MITKLVRLEFELYTKPSNSDFYELINFMSCGKAALTYFISTYSKYLIYNALFRC